MFYSQEESHSRFFRDRNTAFDIDIIRNFRALTRDIAPTMLCNGPAHVLLHDSITSFNLC